MKEADFVRVKLGGLLALDCQQAVHSRLAFPRSPCNVLYERRVARRLDGFCTFRCLLDGPQQLVVSFPLVLSPLCNVITVTVVW